MPYEVCYRALLSIAVVKGLEATLCATHTRRSGLRRAPARRGLYRVYNHLPRPALAGLDHNA